MFNRPNPARATKVWHPNLGVFADEADRGFALSRWQDDASQGFSSDTFGSHDSGFVRDDHPVSHDALSESAQRAFSLLDDVKKQHALAIKALEEQEAASANAHLPFVLDVYEAPEPQRVAAVAPVVQSLSADAFDAPDAQHADAAYDQDDAGEESASTDAVFDAASEVTQEVAQEASVADVESDAWVEEASPDASHDLKAANPAEAQPAQPASVGVAQDEVAEREAAHFAQGLTQGIEQGMAQGLEQGLEQGLAQGIEQGLAQGLEQGLAEGREQGMKEGLALAEEQAREAQARAEQEVTATNDVMAEVSAKLNALLEDPTQFFEPLKRLALHLAEQVVKCELRTSSHAIEQLVQRCLDDLDHPAKGAVVVELNPEDKARLQADGGAFIQGMRLDAVHDMKPGSVRVFANDMVVEDLVEHRLEALARTMLIDVDGWRKQSALAKPDVAEPAQEEAETVTEEATDVHP